MVFVGLLLSAFKIWMVLDAIRRRVDRFWFLIVLVPFGDIVYFFAVKMRDFEARAAAEAPTAPAIARERELQELERAAAETPSFFNRVQLAWVLLEGGKHLRAQQLFAAALASHRTDKEARFGLGLAQLEGGEPQAAVETLSPLVERALDYEHYTGALALAEALYRSGERHKTLELLDMVSGDSQRLEHRLMLARYQLRGDHKVEARETLQQALGEFDVQPERIRMRNGAAATEARRLLRTLEHQLSQLGPSRG